MRIAGGIFGRSEPTEVLAAELKLRAARVAAARSTRWQEIREPELVPRGPFGWLIHEPTDGIFVPKRGSVFAPGGAAVEFARIDDLNLAFFVTSDERVVVLEKLSHPQTWTEHVERREQRRLKVAR